MKAIYLHRWYVDKHTTTMERSNTHPDTDEDDEWEDISSCVLTYTMKKGIVSTELQMAGGGSHAWWYVLEWFYDEYDAEPDVFIKTLYNEKQPTNKTLIIRQEGYSCDVKLVNKGEELPEDDDYEHYSFECMTSNIHYDDDEEDD